MRTHSSFVPGTGSYCASPRSRINSAGIVLTNTVGAAADADVALGSAARTSFQLSSAGSLAKLAGNWPVAVHGPDTLLAFSH